MQDIDKKLQVSDIIQLKLLIFVYETVNNNISSCFHEFFNTTQLFIVIIQSNHIVVIYSWPKQIVLYTD